MKRRILLVMGTAALLALAFVVYDLASRGGMPGPYRLQGPGGDSSGQATTLPGIGDVVPGATLEILDHDPDDHSLRARYFAQRWEKVGQRFHITGPQVDWYLPGGEKLYITARRGDVRPADLGGRFKVLGGHLEEDVWVVLDRNRDPRRARQVPLERRPEDAVRMHLDEVGFDSEYLTIRSSGRVELFSQEVDLLGTGLFVAWSEEPRPKPGGPAGAKGTSRRGELREFRVDRGKWLSIRQGQQRFFEEMWLPGAGGRRRNGGPSAGAGSAFSPAGVAASPAAFGGTPAGLAGPVAWVVPTMLAAPASVPTTTSTASALALPRVPDTYVADFSDDVHVTYDGRYLRGADTLQLVFALKPSDLQRMRQRPSGQEREPTPASRPSGEAGSAAPVDLGKLTTRPSREGESPLTVTWAGPLVVRPYHADELYVEKRFDVMAVGPRLELADDASTAACRRFEFTSPPQRGKLIGAPGRPAELRMSDGSWITVPLVSFERDSEVVRLEGPGTMVLPPETGRQIAEAGAGQPLTITWKQSVDVSFGQLPAERSGQEGGDYLRQAVFAGDVLVRQGLVRTLKAQKLTAVFHEPQKPADPVNRVASLAAGGKVEMLEAESGDFVRCDELNVRMTMPGEGPLQPRWANAKGNVSARQRQTDVTAGELTMTFGPAKGSKGRETYQPQTLDASGEVSITDLSAEQPMRAGAETLSGDLAGGTATLTGKPAWIRYTDNYIEGLTIFIQQSPEGDGGLKNASVTGAGKMRFYAKEDLSGNVAREPIPVQIAWSRSLLYDERQALFDGQVELLTGVDMATGAPGKTGGDSLAANRLNVVLEPPEPAASRPSTRPAGRTAFRPAEADFALRKIAMVIADGEVRFQSQRNDPEGFLLSRATLWSEQLVWHTAARKVKCSKPGRLQLEDYRPPLPPRQGGGGLPLDGGKVQRPSQSFFEWAKSLDMEESAGGFLVSMAGQVRMEHRTGRELLMKEQLHVRPWEQLPVGRNTVLNCQHLLAQFGPTESKVPTTAPATEESGPRLGPLELFDASDEVFLRDSVEGVEIGCQRILYKLRRDHAEGQPKDIAKIMGAPGRDAVVNYRDRSGRLHTLQSPLILWYPETNEFKSGKTQVVGGR